MGFLGGNTHRRSPIPPALDLLDRAATFLALRAQIARSFSTRWYATASRTARFERLIPAPPGQPRRKRVGSRLLPPDQAEAKKKTPGFGLNRFHREDDYFPKSMRSCRFATKDSPLIRAHDARRPSFVICAKPACSGRAAAASRTRGQTFTGRVPTRVPSDSAEVSWRPANAPAGIKNKLHRMQWTWDSLAVASTTAKRAA